MMNHLHARTGLLLIGVFFLFGIFSACESTLMREFNHHMSGSDLNSAKSVVQQQLSRNGQNPEANYLMGNLLSREQNYAEANTYFDKSLKRSSVYREHIDYLRERNYTEEFNQGVEAYQNNRHERAVRQFELALQIFPDRVEAYPLLAKSRSELGQPDLAETAYRACLEFEPAHLECGLNLSEMLVEQERYTDVISVAGPLSREHPEDWRPYRLLTDAYLQTSQYDRAEESFSNLISKQNRYDNLKQFALSLYNKGEIRRAEPYLVSCLERNATDPDILQVLAGIYLDSGNYELVIDAGNRLLDADPQNSSIKAKLMIAYELTGDIDRYKEMQAELGLNEE